MRLAPLDQTTFGGPTDPPEVRGNCYPACIASIVGCAIDDVPHIYGVGYGGDDEAALRRLCSWLADRGWSILCFRWDETTGIGDVHMPNAAVILSGKSPRGEWQHAVVGEIRGSLSRVIHDPHPSRAGLDGPPGYVEILFQLVLI